MGQPPSQADRLRQIEQMLHHALDGLRASEIAERLAVSQSTVYRDLE